MVRAGRLWYGGRMHGRILTGMVGVWLAATSLARAQEAEAPAIGGFHNVTAGQYQVLAQGSRDVAWQANRFMNDMLRQYSTYFSNWSLKAAARVVIFSDVESFRAYSAAATGLTHESLTGYCHLKTDEDGNTFYELVSYEHDRLWQVLAHEGFHQFLGYELGLQVPIWLNEGMAQYFETSQVVRSRLQTGLVSKQKLRAAQHLIGSQQAVALSDLIQMDRETFYQHSQVTYPLSWALVYYLMNREGRSFQAGTFRRYLHDLKLGRDEVGSFQQRFGRDISRWQPDFERFILGLQPHVD
jgi:hypothetical protein